MEGWRKKGRGGPNWRASDAAEVGDLRALSWSLLRADISQRDVQGRRRRKPLGEILGGRSPILTRRRPRGSLLKRAISSAATPPSLAAQSFKGSRLAGKLSSHFFGSALTRSPAIGSCLRLSNFKWPGGGCLFYELSEAGGRSSRCKALTGRSEAAHQRFPEADFPAHRPPSRLHCPTRDLWDTLAGSWERFCPGQHL